MSYQLEDFLTPGEKQSELSAYFKELNEREDEYYKKTTPVERLKDNERMIAYNESLLARGLVDENDARVLRQRNKNLKMRNRFIKKAVRAVARASAR